MATRQTALFACILSAIFSVGAHDAPLPETCSMVGAKRVTISSFRFTEKELLRGREAHSSNTCPLTGNNSKRDTATARESPGAPTSPTASSETPDAGSTAKCGVVDEYHIGTMMIVKYCNESKLSNGQASFRVASPVSYNARIHHKSYGFSDGDLVGTCFICVVRRPIQFGPAYPAEPKPLD